MSAVGNLTVLLVFSANGTSFHQSSSQETRLVELIAFLPYLLILLSITTTLANLAVLAAFFVNRHLRTPFNYYLVSLIISDIGQAAFDLPFGVVSMFNPVFSLGRTACNFNLYAKWVFSGVVRNTHSLISLNRIWALFWPVAYKHYHTKTTAIWLCIGTWVYVHLWLMPGMIPDAMGLRKDDGTCYVNTTAQPTWALATQMCLYNSTLVIIVVTYPFIWWKIRLRRRDILPKVGKPPVSKSSPNAVSETLGRQLTSAVATEMDLHDDAEDEPNPVKENKKQINSPKDLKDSTSTKQSQSFAVLTYLVVGVVICWTPILTYFTLSAFTGYDNNLYFIVGSLLYYCNSLLDPIFFCVAIRPLRATMLHFFRNRN